MSLSLFFPLAPLPLQPTAVPRNSRPISTSANRFIFAPLKPKSRTHAVSPAPIIESDSSSVRQLLRLVVGLLVVGLLFFHLLGRLASVLGSATGSTRLGASR